MAAVKRRERKPKAREPEAKVAKGQRVEHIMKMMAAGKFVNGKSHMAIMSLYGIAYETATQDIAEASRSIRRGLALSDELRDLIVVQLQNNTADLDDIANDPLTEPKDRIRAIEAKTKAVSVMAGISGAAAPKKIEAKHEIDPADANSLRDRLRQVIGVTATGIKDKQ